MGAFKRFKARLPWWTALGWRSEIILPILFIIELPLTIAALALFGIADPDTYRSSLWTEGSKHGWNSDPIELLYAAANYKPIPAPVPWSQFMTDWNVVVSVLSMFILLVKCVLYISHVFPPLFSAVVHFAVVVIWVVAIYQQAAPDYSDPQFPSKSPWYLTRGCGAPVDPIVVSGCRMAIGSFAVTIVMCALFLTYFIYSLISCFPTAAQQQEAREALQSDDEESSPVYDDKQFEYEMSTIPKTPMTSTWSQQQAPPATPRTQAFNALEGKKTSMPKPKQVSVAALKSTKEKSIKSLPMSPLKSPPMSPNHNQYESVNGGTTSGELPLRHHISMGAEPVQTKSRFSLTRGSS